MAAKENEATAKTGLIKSLKPHFQCKQWKATTLMKFKMGSKNKYNNWEAKKLIRLKL